VKELLKMVFYGGLGYLIIKKIEEKRKK